jgi:Tfp pilus assembly protein PilE
MITGVMAAIAIPAYRAYSGRAHRVEAISALEQIAVNQRRFHIDLKTFTTDWNALGFPGGLSTNGVYIFDFPVAPDTVGVTIRARPAPGGG